MNNLYDVLEICLQEIDRGDDVDTVLFRYPEFAEELRLILEASEQAKLLAAAEPSAELVRRNRSKVLQQAAQMREAKAPSSRRLWSVPLRRALVSLAVIAVLFISSTSLVRAASTTLPGDNLYPVKRTWEGVRVLFTFNSQAREAIEIEHENERLDELNELFAEGRSAKVDFAGMVISQTGDRWLVGEIPVLISAQTEFKRQPAKVGDAVRVKGYTQADGTVLAEKVELLPAGNPLPDADDDHNSGGEQEDSETQPETTDDDSNDGSGEQTPKVEETEAPEEDSSPEKSSLDGVVDSVDGTLLSVNGQPLDISGAEVKGTPKAGTAVKVEGYYDANGVFIVTKIEFQSSDSDGGASTSTEAGNDNSEKDQSGSDGGDSNDDNGNDDSGGDNSGSGSGEDSD